MRETGSLIGAATLGIVIAGAGPDDSCWAEGF